MIAQTFRGPHNLYRRYQASIETALASLGLAIVVTLTLQSFAVYPSNWVTVIGIAIAMLGIWWPTLAFSLIVVATTYPLSLINFYLAVLFLAICTLGHRLFVHYLGATFLILGTPLLGEYHLHWLVPILVGLWWGGTTGAWVGALACIWGKFIGGQVGLNIDWLVMAGQTADVSALAARFDGANSLQTLLRLVEPFAADPDVILYNLLQIISWAVAAGVVGFLAQQQWVKYRAPWSIFLLTTSGGLILFVTQLTLPYWLQNAATPEALAVVNNPIGPLFSLVVVIITGTVVYSVRESLDLPVAPAKPAWAKRRRAKNKISQSTRNQPNQGAIQKKMVQPIKESPHPSPKPVAIPSYSELPEWEPPKDASGLIMLEID